jgi:hypothetical protein
VDDGLTPTYDNFTVEYVHVGTTLASHDLGCNEVFATTTTAGDLMHSSIDDHSDTTSC